MIESNMVLRSSPSARKVWLSSLLVGMACWTGCGDDGPTRYHVRGTVTSAGQPVPAGVIFFDPDSGRGNTGPQGYAYIKDGAYDTRNDGAGSAGGALIARVEGFDGQPGEELPLGKMIFGEHEFEIELPFEETEHNFVLPARKQKNR